MLVKLTFLLLLLLFDIYLDIYFCPLYLIQDAEEDQVTKMENECASDVDGDVCSGRGRCFAGECQCVQGYYGILCNSISERDVIVPGGKKEKEELHVVLQQRVHLALERSANLALVGRHGSWIRWKLL